MALVPSIGWGVRPRRPSAAAWSAVLALVLATPGPGKGDGGTLRAANVPMGGYRVSVFTAPTPIPPDSIDVSILATAGRGREIARGLRILVTARRADGRGSPLWHEATPEQAEDPRFYAAKFALGASGEWDLRIEIQGPEGEGEVSFRVQVREPGLLNSPYAILALGLVPLAVAAGWMLRPPPSPTPR